VIIALAPIMVSQLKQGGILITSGIIDVRKDEVINALKANCFEIIEINEDRGWVGLVCSRG
jgi:ribosomal protein L11 methyltransferase